jgi:hypothetical protein
MSSARRIIRVRLSLAAESSSFAELSSRFFHSSSKDCSMSKARSRELPEEMKRMVLAVRPEFPVADPPKAMRTRMAKATDPFIVLA